MMLNLSAAEVETLRGMIKSSIDCERDSARHWPEDAPMFLEAANNWRSIRRKILKSLKPRKKLVRK